MNQYSNQMAMLDESPHETTSPPLTVGVTALMGEPIVSVKDVVL